MGSADYLKLGDWNARCDKCGTKYKGTELKLQWNSIYACTRCWEPRQPQDFVRAVIEHPTPPFVRNPADVILPLCGPNGRTSIANFSVADCWIADFIDPAFDPAVNP